MHINWGFISGGYSFGGFSPGGYPRHSQHSFMARQEGRERYYNNLADEVEQFHVLSSMHSSLRQSMILRFRWTHRHIDEVRAAIKKLKFGLAAGRDAISPEMLKLAIEPTSRILHQLFASVWTTGKVPWAWKEGLVISL